MIAQGLATNGAKVYITGRRKEVLSGRADSVKGKLGDKGGQIIPLQMDVTNKDSILAGRSFIEKETGKLHILVNNAGQVGPVSPFIYSRNSHMTASSFGDGILESESFEEWSQNMTINVSASYFVSAAFLGLLGAGAEARQGISSSIVNITSTSGLAKISQDHFCYNVGKAAISHMTKILATELALRKLPIRVNAIAPGVYESEMTTDNLVGLEAVSAVGKPLYPIPTERAGSATEISATILLLVSQSGSFINGQEIVLDGGYLAVNPSTR